MKTCSKCKQEKSTASFGKRTNAPDGLQAHCKQCRSEYQKKWYADAPSIQKQRVTAAARKNRAEARAIVRKHLSTHPCIDCGETDIVVLEFDHRDPAEKTQSIAAMFRDSWIIIQKLMIEIAKCDIRCANCHRRRTAQQFGW